MGTLVAWLNANQGFALVLLTLVYVAATVVMAVLARRANALASQQLRQALDLDEKRSRPYVVFDFVPGEYDVHACLRNIGEVAALSVNIDIAPVPEKSCYDSRLEPLSLASTTVRLLAPGAHAIECVDDVAGFKKRYGSTTFQGAVRYSDAVGLEYRESFSVSLPDPEHVFHAPGGDVARKLSDIADSLHMIEQKLRQ